MRVLAALALACALTIAPSAAFADTFTGTPGSDDTITGTSGSDAISGDGDASGGDDLDGGNDTINGDGDDDQIYGDGAAYNDGDLNGGNDTVDGGGGDDEIVGDGDVYDGGDLNGGADRLDGGDGDDYISGDGFASDGGDLNGGDDVIYGGDGDDDIIGDGGVNFGSDGAVNGGDDEIHGGAGNDNIAGDGFESQNVNGGNDILFGDVGDDNLVGESGNDILCGGDGHMARNDADSLIGAEGDDLACAVDDEATVTAGEGSTYALAANDEILDDEDQETLALIYGFCGNSGLPSGITGSIAPTTGVFTYTATQSGTVQYSVSRGESEVALSSCADFVINVLMPEVDPPADDTSDADPAAAPFDEGVDSADVGTPVLPDTGAGQDMFTLAGLGIALLISGTVVLVGTRRRQPATPVTGGSCS